MGKRMFRPILKGLAFLGLSLGLSFVLFHVIWQPFQVYGTSMSPTLAPGDYLLVDRVWFRQGDLRRGDLVVLRHPRGSAFIVKRVVGLGGDTVEWRSGKIAVNGRSWSHPPSARPDSDGIFESWVVPPAAVFCLGDNLPTSEDSRSFGPVESDRVYGRVVLCYLPPARWQWLLPKPSAAETPGTPARDR